MNTTSTIPLKDSSLSLQIDGKPITNSDGFKVESLSIQEGIFKVPTFIIEFSTTFNSKTFNMSEINISLETSTMEGGKFKVNYLGTIISLSVSRMDGVLIRKSSYLDRQSQSFGDTSLDSVIKNLNITNTSFTLDSKIQGNNNFYQLNETNWQCASRLLNLMGEDKLWAVAEDKVKLFSSKVTNPKKISIGKYETFSMNNLMLMKNGPDSIDSNSNLYFGTSNTCIPSISGYSKTCVASLMNKGKYSKWRNVSVTKTLPMRISNLSIGDSVRFDWQTDTITDFILIDMDSVYGQGGCSFTYTFANYDSWNPGGRT